MTMSVALKSSTNDKKEKKGTGEFSETAEGILACFPFSVFVFN